MSTPNFAVAKTLISLLTGRTLNVRLALIVGLALEVSGIALSAAGPFALKIAVDHLAQANVPGGLVVFAISGFVMAWALSAVVSVWRLVYSTRVINILSRYLTVEAMKGYLPNSVRAKDGDSGQALGLVERLPYSLQTVVDGLLWRGGPMVVQLAVTLALVVEVVPPIYAVLLATLAILFGASSWVSAKRYGKYSNAANDAASLVSQVLGDITRNARRVVLNGALSLEAVEVERRYSGKLRADEKVVWSLLTMTMVQFGLIAAGLILMLAMAVNDVTSARITIGDFVLLQTFAFRLILPLSGFGFIVSQAGTAFANIEDVLKLLPSKGGRTPAPIHFETPGQIALRDVTFHYGDGHIGLEGVSLDFTPGTFNLIVGANGSGKSTLAQIITGVLPPDSGEVSVNGQALSKLAAEERYRHALYVPQFIGLFNRSLAANAFYPPTRHTAEKMAETLYELQFYKAGKAINFEQSVGEQGERLSGGQIQKLELARLIGTDIPILVLDESTSALDTVSEAVSLASLRKTLGDNRTLILVTHRLSVAPTADRICVMDRGQVVAFGSHDHLLRRSPHYRNLQKEPAEL